MDKNSFGRMMDNPWSLTPAEWEELRRERDKYPFCAPLQVVSLMADKAGGAVLWEKQALPVVSLYVQDVERLLERLEKGAETPDVRETVAAEPKREERQEVKEHKEEPLPEDSPLWEAASVTPHNSFVGEGNGDRLYRLIKSNLEKAQ